MDMAVRKNLASSRVRKSGRTFSLEKGFGGRDKVKRQAVVNETRQIRAMTLIVDTKPTRSK